MGRCVQKKGVSLYRRNGDRLDFVKSERIVVDVTSRDGNLLDIISNIISVGTKAAANPLRFSATCNDSDESDESNLRKSSHSSLSWFIQSLQPKI